MMTDEKRARAAAILDRTGVDQAASLLSAIKQMDRLDRKLLLVTDQGRYIGLLSLGDIQRAIIQGVALERPVSDAMRANIRVARVSDAPEETRASMIRHRMELMPVLDDEGGLADVIVWSDLFEEQRPPVKGTEDIPAVIMAGGRGTRLRPITNIIPKPLVPLGDKPIIERIVDAFTSLGTRKFYFSVNYKADLIQHYFEGLGGLDYEIEYIEEKKPLGTAGSLHLLRGKIDSTFFVSNCDILVDQDLNEPLHFHNDHGNTLTLLAALKHVSIPYGTVEVGPGGLLTSLKEKPELTYLVNTGLYILESSVLDLVPEDELFHITHLIERVQADGGRVGVFPVSEGSWLDVGDWKDYFRTQALYEKRTSRRSTED